LYAYIRGTVANIEPDRAIVEACGIGYELFCSALTLKTLAVGKEATLVTHLHLAEGIMALYGFASQQERQMFRRLIGVSRIGPKLALSMLSVLSPTDIAAAIITDNAAAFDPVPGMGRKTAQRVLLELKEKIGTEELVSLPADAPAPMQADATAALVSLGYDGASASRAVTAVTGAKNVEELITLALRELAKQM